MGLGRTVVSDDEDEIQEEEDETEVRRTDDVDVGEGDEEDEEEDEEGQDEYEKDGFIVDDMDEEEEEEEERADSDEEEKQKKKKRKKRESEKNYVLDEDDYELLQDNNITGFHRPKPGSQKFKRLKKAGRDSEQDDHSGFSDEEVLDKSGRSGRTAEEKLKRSLFGDDEGPPLEDIAEEEEQMEEEEDGYIGEEDEMADFIVDEEEVDENGAPVRRRKPNKKKSRQAPGVSSSALQEAHDIFGDVDELLILRKQGLAKTSRFDDSGEWREKRLEDEFEPLILTEKYMTVQDDRIREIDVPERIQISEESTGPAPTDTKILSSESGWIQTQLATILTPLYGKEVIEGLGQQVTDLAKQFTVEDITRFLEMFHVQKYDIPFIAMYRKEFCTSLFKDWGQDEEEREDMDKTEGKRTLKWHKVLWAIKDLDRKWLLLQKRKSALQLYYNKRFEEESRRIYDETRLTLNHQLFQSIIESLEKAESEREVDDVDLKFNLHFPPGEVGVEEGQFKRPKRKSQYNICSKAGLWEIARKVGYSSEQFGKHIALENMGDELEDAKETPEEIASNFTCAMFETPQAVLKGARHMAAVEISCEPPVRKHVRGMFMDNAVVSTCPTAEGNAAIDSFHQFAGVKWLHEKPLTKFEDAQWLLIQKAEEEKLLQVSIKLPEHNLNKLISESNDYYLSDGVSKSAQLWNEQRKLILQDAFFNFLIPSMEKEARSILTARAKYWILMEYGQHLWSKVSVAPYHRKENDQGSDDEAAPRVMACCWGRPATTFVMLDSSGEVLDVLYTGYLSSRSQSANEQQRKKNDEQRVMKFMTDHQPHIAILGAVTLSCTRLKDEIYDIIFKTVEERPRDIGPEMDGLIVVYGDESLPRLYENSRISSDQLPGQSGSVKRAVALGRYLQNSLAMVATLCGPGKEILSWKLGSFDHFLTPDEKYGMVEQVMVDVTNQVGLDVNLAASHEWLFAPLQFVSGLGPRKAASLQRALVRAGSVSSRKELTAHGIKKKVFINAIGFLRIRRSGLMASSSHFIDLLDDTRIHPESYDLAKEMAKDAYMAENNLEADDDVDDDVLEMAIEHVRDKSSMLKSLDINEYSLTHHNKIETLNDIKKELLHGFQDWRTPYQDISQDKEFYMISGETEDTICEGRIVQVKARRVQPQRVICELDSGITGLLFKEDTDYAKEDDLTDKLREGDIITCKIKQIEMNRYQVFLTCRESDLKSDRYQKPPERDYYYHESQSNIQSEQEKARKEKELAKKHFKPRMIVHPRFQNITADEAMEFLSEKEVGESIVRPSSRGPCYLTLTLKVYDGVFAHKDIVEGGKEHKDITSLLRLGKTLKIGDDTFEDLDEVMDRYVDPLVTHLKTMLSYRKFKRGSKAEVDDLLRVEKSEQPARIVYCFGISHEHPGTFILSYIRSANPHHEYISVYPKGFKFRKKMFEDIDRLVAYFQRHIDDMQHDVPSIRSVAAMVPMRSPATGGSSGGGGSVGSAWGASSPNSNDGGGWQGSSNSDRERSSTPGSRTGGRNDYRNGGGGDRDGHPSGLPRPYGGRGDRGRGGRGRGDRGRGGRGSYGGRGRNNYDNDRQDSGYEAPKWGSSSNDGGDGGWSSFPGAKVQNSPGREAFPGGRGSYGGRGGNNYGNERQDSGYEASKWGSSSKDGGDVGWNSFPGAKVQNSPGREAFPGGWGTGGSGTGGGDNGGWGSGGSGTGGGGSGGWGTGGSGTGGGGSGGWGGTGGSGTGGGGSGGWGGTSGSGTGGGGNVENDNGGGWDSAGAKGGGGEKEKGNSGWGNNSKKDGSDPPEGGNGWSSGGGGWNSSGRGSSGGGGGGKW